MPRRPFPTRSDATVFLPWCALLGTELWFGLQAFTPHTTLQISLECASLLLLGLCQARLPADETWRSPLVPGFVAFVWTWILLGPVGPARLPFTLGLVGALVFCTRQLERWRRWGLVSGLLAAVLGGVGARALVLYRSSRGDDAARGTVAGHPLALLRKESIRPLTSRALSPTSEDTPSILLLTVDTLRADHAPLMETWSRLAERGSTWSHAASTSSWTVPAVASFLTGLPPTEHGAGLDDIQRLQGLSPEVPTLAEVLSSGGFATAGVVTNAWLTHDMGFDRGFHTYLHPDERFHHLFLVQGFPAGAEPFQAERVVDRAIHLLDAAPKHGLFLWVHLIDPHLPYNHAVSPEMTSLSDTTLRGGMRLTPTRQDRIREAYRDEVRAADRALVRLLDAWEDHVASGDNIIAFTADHGEEFWEHGNTGHGHQHHGEVTDVPIALVGPGVPIGPRTDLASLVDIPTTLAAMAGLQFGSGRDLRTSLPPDRIVSTWGCAYYLQQASARTLEQRAIVPDVAQGDVLCFDLRDDPEEMHPRPCDPHSPLVRTARGLRAPSPHDGGGADQAMEALKALGYVNE